MRTDVDHLPEKQQAELKRVQEILLHEFGEAISRSTSDSRRYGKIYKIILFGSYARDDWVDDAKGGYQSDFDLLVVVSHKDLTDISDYWYVAEDKILRDPSIGRLVNIIVHSFDEVNDALSRGEYFWTDIARDGIALYELKGYVLAAPKPLTPADAYRMARSYFDGWFEKIGDALLGAQFYLDHGKVNDAAFTLHLATERAYVCFLLVTTLYFPKSHNVKFLRSLSEAKDARLIAAWPRDTKLERRRFELLKRAYVEARYSPHYKIGKDDLDWLIEGVRRLRDIVAAVGEERLATLKAEAGL